MEQYNFTMINYLHLTKALDNPIFMKDYVSIIKNFNKDEDKINYINSNSELQRLCMLDYELNKGY